MAGRYALSSLLLAPLVLSPLCLGLKSMADMLASRDHRLGLEVLVFAAGYSTLLALWSRYAPAQKDAFMLTQPFAAMLVIGAFWGAVFGALLLVPYAAADAIVYYRLMTFDRAVFVLTATVDVTGVFTLIGTACGGLMGLVLPRADAKGLNAHATDQRREPEH